MHKLKTAITRLYFDENQNLVGFFTLHNDLVRLAKNQKKKLNEEHKWHLAKYNLLPSVKLHGLWAIDSAEAGQGPAVGSVTFNHLTFNNNVTNIKNNTTTFTITVNP